MEEVLFKKHLLLGGKMKRKLQFISIVLTVTMMLPVYLWGGAMKPSSMAELALYKGADRQRILEEGAKKEGKLTFYTGGVLTQGVRPAVAAFEKKYPYIKVTIWNASADQTVPKVLEESKSKKNLVDAIEITKAGMSVFQKTGIIAPFYSPEFLQIEEEALTKADGGGAYSVAFYSTGIGFGYNTKMVRKDQVPKTYQDLLDPRWKGKLAITGNFTGITWADNIYQHFGEDLLKKIASQDMVVHMVSARAIIDLVINGEYPASPTIFGPHVYEVKKKSAPIEWVPLEPVYCNLMNIAVARDAPNPHAALLFADSELSLSVAEIERNTGYDIFRKDLPSQGKSFKKYFGKDSAMEDVKQQQERFQRLFMNK